VEHNRCIDDRLIAKCFHCDAELMKFIGAQFVQGDMFGATEEERHDRWVVSDDIHAKHKDSGQRLACGCIMSKDIGEYNTCSHLCHYCYANLNNVTALSRNPKECKMALGDLFPEGMEPADYLDYLNSQSEQLDKTE
ncbi:MAG: DUF1848 family protein, partial [Prevotella sp.]